MSDMSQQFDFSDNLKGKVAAVLGASANGGTGWAIAEALARCGAKVVVGARTIDTLQILADKVGGTAISCDAGNESQVQAMAQLALDRYGGLDIAVNSAGLPVMSSIEDFTQKHLDDSIRVNYFGQAYFIKHMAKAIGSNGSIVFVSSMSTTHPVLPHALYACAKSASDCLVRYAALEYGPRNIRVNSILPGAILSEMTREAFSNQAFVDIYASQVPLGRIGKPEDFANAVLWLAGPSYVTGTNIQVNGGNQLTRMPFLSELPMGREAYGDTRPLGDR